MSMHSGSARADREVIVVGAGPAGSTCAIYLAQRGHAVTIVDQSTFPRDKPCGDGLTRSSVSALEELGLGRLVRDHQSITGARVVPPRGREMTKRYQSGPGRPPAGVCVPRSVLDEALLTAALDRGAQLIRGRVEGPVVVDAAVRGVTYSADGQEHTLHAAHVVAADGATSRMRRALFGDRVGSRGRAFAARAYFQTERPLDPVFDIYLPIELNGRRFPGYGWVFPLGEHRANIGVGFFSSGGRAGRVSVRRMFEVTVDSLFRGVHRKRFGDLEQEGSLFGSPLALHFVRDHCDYEGVTFVGDAANTVDPLSGEGIAYAMRGAEIVAEAVHRRLTRGGPSARTGKVLARRFPRLGQEPWRTFHVVAGSSGAGLGGGLGGALDEPFLATAVRVAAKTETDPSISHTFVWQFAERAGGEYVEALERLDEDLLATTETKTPLIGEIVHRQLRAHGGPFSAATALFALLAAGGRLSDEAVGFASAVALTEVLPSLVSQISDRAAGDKTASANDRMVVMATDFAHSRAAVAAAAAGPELLGMFAQATCAVCEGQMLQREDRGRLDPRHAERIASMSGSLFALAAAGGAVQAGQPRTVQRQLERFGLQLGCAKRIADEMSDLVVGEPSVGRSPAVAARRGFYCLSMLEVARRNGQKRNVDDLVAEAISDEEALRAASDAIDRHAADAAEILSTIGLPDPSPLMTLVEATVDRSRSMATIARSEPAQRLAQVEDSLLLAE